MILSWSCLVLVHLTSTFLESVVLSYFGPYASDSLKVDFLENVHQSCTPASVRAQKPTRVSVFCLPCIVQRMFDIYYLEKISGESNFGQSKCSKIKQSEIWSVRNILQYSIKFFSSSKALSFHEANSSWDTVWDAWRSDRISVIFFSVYL